MALEAADATPGRRTTPDYAEAPLSPGPLSTQRPP